MVLLEGKKLNKTYGEGESAQIAVNDIDITVESGEFVVIMGNSGSGKSTLLYLLSGLDSLASGSVVFAKKELLHMNDKARSKFRRKHVGFVFQDHALISDLTLFQNIAAPGYLDGKASKVNERAKMLCAALGIEGHEGKYSSEVSGGQLQRASIARALINKPNIIFCDEPTGNLDSKNRNSVLNILSKLNAKGHTIIMVTHDAQAALRASRILYLSDGEIKSKLGLGAYSGRTTERTTAVSTFLAKNGWAV